MICFAGNVWQQVRDRELAMDLTQVTFLDVIFAMNPVTLWYTCRVWFMENDPALCFPGSEAVSLFLQFLTAGILLAGSWKQFRNRDMI